MAVGDLYRVSFAYGVDGQTNINVYYMKQEASIGGDEDAKRVAEVAGASLATRYSFILAQGTRTPRQCTAQLVSRTAADIGEYPYTFTAGQGPAGDSLPSLIAVVIRLRTGLAGRTRRGRVYIGGVSQTYEANGLVTPTGNTAYASFITSMLSEFTGGAPTTGMRLGVFSRTRYAILSNPFDEYFAPVTSMSQVDAVASQRRRRVGIGS